MRLFAVFKLRDKFLAEAFEEVNIGIEKHVRTAIRDGTGRKPGDIDHRGGLQVHKRLCLGPGNIRRIDNGDITCRKLLKTFRPRGAIVQCGRLTGLLRGTGKQSHAPHSSLLSPPAG